MAVVLGFQDLECSLQDALDMVDLLATRLAVFHPDGCNSPAFSLKPEASYSFEERIKENNAYRARARSDGGFKAACATRAARYFHDNSRRANTHITNSPTLDGIEFMAFPSHLHHLFTFINEFITFTRSSRHGDIAVLDLASTPHECPGEGPEIVAHEGDVLSILGTVQQIFGTICLLEHRGQRFAIDLFDLPSRVIRSGGSIGAEGIQVSITTEQVGLSQDEVTDHAMRDAGSLDAPDRSIAGSR